MDFDSPAMLLLKSIYDSVHSRDDKTLEETKEENGITKSSHKLETKTSKDAKNVSQTLVDKTTNNKISKESVTKYSTGDDESNYSNHGIIKKSKKVVSNNVLNVNNTLDKLESAKNKNHKFACEKSQYYGNKESSVPIEKNSMTNKSKLHQKENMNDITPVLRDQNQNISLLSGGELSINNATSNGLQRDERNKDKKFHRETSFCSKGTFQTSIKEFVTVQERANKTPPKKKHFSDADEVIVIDDDEEKNDLETVMSGTKRKLIDDVNIHDKSAGADNIERSKEQNQASEPNSIMCKFSKNAGTTTPFLKLVEQDKLMPKTNENISKLVISMEAKHNPEKNVMNLPKNYTDEYVNYDHINYQNFQQNSLTNNVKPSEGSTNLVANNDNIAQTHKVFHKPVMLLNNTDHPIRYSIVRNNSARSSMGQQPSFGTQSNNHIIAQSPYFAQSSMSAQSQMVNPPRYPTVNQSTSSAQSCMFGQALTYSQSHTQVQSPMMALTSMVAHRNIHAQFPIVAQTPPISQTPQVSRFHTPTHSPAMFSQSPMVTQTQSFSQTYTHSQSNLVAPPSNNMYYNQYININNKISQNIPTPATNENNSQINSSAIYKNGQRTLSNLNKDKFRAIIPKNSNCDICQFETPINNLGIRILPELSPSTCHICHRTYQTRHSLAIHMSSHSGKKPRVCEKCLKLFLEDRGTEVPKYTFHRIYECYLCKTLKTDPIESAYFHCPEPFKCICCEAKFDQLNKLKTHMYTAHRQKFKCEKCEFAHIQRKEILRQQQYTNYNMNKHWNWH